MKTPYNRPTEKRIGSADPLTTILTISYPTQVIDTFCECDYNSASLLRGVGVFSKTSTHAGLT